MFNGLKNLFKKKKAKKVVLEPATFKAADVSMQAPPATYVSKRIKAIPYDDNNRRMSILFVPVLSSGEIIDYLPVASEDNGDGTASIKISGDFTVGDITVDPDTNIERWGGTIQTGADLTPLFQHLDIDLSTRASETTLSAAKTVLDSILSQLNVNLSSRSSEATLALVKSNLDDVKTKLDTLNAKDFSTQTTLDLIRIAIESIDSDINVQLSTRATETTLSSVKTNLDDVKTKLDILNAKDFSTQSTLASLNSKDFATQTTLAQVKTDLDSILANINVALSTRATEATLALIKAKTDNIDAFLSTRATESTLSNVKTNLDDIKTKLDALQTELNQKTEPANQQHVIIDTIPAVDITDDTTRELGRILASDLLIASENFSITSATYAAARVADVNIRGYKTKTIAVLNTSAFNGRVRILGSVDNGTSFDVTILADSALNAAVTSITTFADAVTHVRVEVRSQNGANTTTYTTRGYALGV